MGNHHAEGSGSRRRLWWAVGLIALAGAIAALVGTGVLRLGKSGDSPQSAEHAAQQRCQAEVVKRLVSPDKATIAELHTQTSTLDSDGRDFSSLNTNENLKGVDTSRITVLNVAGVVNAPSEVGTTISDHFDCRAYFVDGSLVHTLVVFDHAH